MNKKILYQIILVVLVIILTGCDDEKKTEPMESDLVFQSRIDKIVPTKFRIGDTISIYGHNFGPKRDINTLELNGLRIDKEGYLFWSDSLIKVVIPEGAESGSLYLNRRGSNDLSYEVDYPLYHRLINLFVKISLGITLIYMYLRVNKIWKRKHEREVAESQSLAGLFIYILNCVLWVIYYGFVSVDPMSVIDTSIYIFEGSIFFVIGTGVFVKGQGQFRFWFLIKRALKIERSEADYLLKKFFKPKNADKIIDILHQLAMIDEELDPKELALIESFAKEWNIDYSPEKYNKGRVVGTEHNYIKLRHSLEDYLSYDPPREQVGQLRDMMTALIHVDDKVTKEEELINSELMGLISEFMQEEKQNLYHVLLVPQQPEHETIIRHTFPEAQRLQISGGVAYSIGSYYSYKYADMICKERRKINMFTIVHAPDESESKFYIPQGNNGSKVDR